MIDRGSPPRPALVAGAALGLQALLLLWPATLGGQAFFRRDVHLMWHAQAEVQARSWSEGSRRLWNPSASFGQPLLADANNQVFYPLAPLHRVLPPWTFYTVYAALHLALAGGGAAFLARRVGLAWLPAWAAGSLWMCSGPLLSLVDTWNQLAGAAWMPWAMAAGLQALSPGGLRPALAWAAVTALQILAGAPEMVVLATCGLAALAVAQARGRPSWRTARRMLLGAAGGGILALGLAACQWAPALEAARLAGRTDVVREARTHWSVHPLNLVQTLCPVALHRLPLAGEARVALYGAPDPFLPSIYLGAVSAVLVAATLCRPRRLTVALAAAVVLPILVALGRHAPFYDAAVALAPPLRAFRYPAKALLLTSLAWCLLCGYGLAALAERPPRRWLAGIAAGLAIVSALLAALLVAGGGALTERFLAASGVAGVRLVGWRLGTAALLAALAGGLALRGTAAAARVLLALALLDLTAAHFDLNPTAPVALYTRQPPALATALDAGGGRLFVWDYFERGAGGAANPYRLSRAPARWDARAAQALGLRETLFPPTAASWGSAGSYDRDVAGLEPRPMALLKDAFRGASAERRLRLLRLGAVSRVVALHAEAGEGLELLGRHQGLFADAVRVFGVPDALPRAYVVGTGHVRANDREALAALLDPAFAPDREVVLAAGPGGAAVGFAGNARVLDRRTDRVVLDSSASGAGWLVLVDAWDPGWRVTVDGRAARLERANLAFRAVAVPEGRHRVEFVYRPAVVGPALWVSAASLAWLAGSVGWLAWRRRSRAVALRQGGER